MLLGNPSEPRPAMGSTRNMLPSLGTNRHHSDHICKDSVRTRIAGNCARHAVCPRGFTAKGGRQRMQALDLAPSKPTMVGTVTGTAQALCV